MSDWFNDRSRSWRRYEDEDDFGREEGRRDFDNRAWRNKYGREGSSFQGYGSQQHPMGRQFDRQEDEDRGYGGYAGYSNRQGASWDQDYNRSAEDYRRYNRPGFEDEQIYRRYGRPREEYGPSGDSQAGYGQRRSQRGYGYQRGRMSGTYQYNPGGQGNYQRPSARGGYPPGVNDRTTYSRGEFGGPSGNFNEGYDYEQGGWADESDIDYDDEDYAPTSFTYTEYWLIPGPFTGSGPRGYQRSDERVHEDVCERLTQHGQLDASELDVEVKNGEVTLRGQVESRRAKRMAEDAVDDIPGVKDVHNEIRIREPHSHPATAKQPRFEGQPERPFAKPGEPPQGQEQPDKSQGSEISPGQNSGARV